MILSLSYRRCLHWENPSGGEIPRLLCTIFTTICGSNYFKRKVKNKTPQTPPKSNHLQSNHFHPTRTWELAPPHFPRPPGTGSVNPAFTSNTGSSGTGVRLAQFQSDQEGHVPEHWALRGVGGYFAKSPSQSHSEETDWQRQRTAFPSRTQQHWRAYLKLGLGSLGSSVG